MNYEKKSMIWYSIMFSLILLLPLYYDVLSTIPHFCLFQNIFSINCPGCGMLRGTAPFYLMVQGNVIVHASSKSQFFTIRASDWI